MVIVFCKCLLSQQERGSSKTWGGFGTWHPRNEGSSKGFNPANHRSVSQARSIHSSAASCREGKRQNGYAREDPIEMCDAFKHRCILSSIIWGSCHCLWVSLTWDWGGWGCSVTCHTKYTCLPWQRVTGQQETAELGRHSGEWSNREHFFAYLSSPDLTDGFRMS